MTEALRESHSWPGSTLFVRLHGGPWDGETIGWPPSAYFDVVPLGRYTLERRTTRSFLNPWRVERHATWREWN